MKKNKCKGVYCLTIYMAKVPDKINISRKIYKIILHTD